ncbi:MAG: archease [Deltaproteobacteria bacterium]|nr:archease [Deltaproteobacteria bacterium]
MEHTADIGIRAEGAALEEVVEAAAEALLNSVFDLESVSSSISVSFGAEAPDEAAAIVEALNELLFIIDRHSLAVKRLRTVKVIKKAGSVLIIAAAHGEPFNEQRHEVKTEVKAATYSGLKYEEKDVTCSFECVLDV